MLLHVPGGIRTQETHFWQFYLLHLHPSLSFLAHSWYHQCSFVPFLNPMRSQESQPTLNYTKLVLKVPCHTWGKKNAFGCSGLVLPTRWLPRNGGSLLLWPWEACLCLPSLILLVLLPLGDILLRIVWLFRNDLFFSQLLGTEVIPCASVPVGQQALRSEPGMMSVEFKVEFKGPSTYWSSKGATTNYLH